ncbi:amino acid adenylation domain-containing protein [Streptomyces formicae]|uniref:Amino acid adenylation domain-containing protein n=1 Tax=Streptomyces formicae TaxID=1616117 RepID=A0ABY3WW60_9ACTN|nr:amino acid adenylation domain-containing protein [Streptomyces formicae]
MSEGFTGAENAYPNDTCLPELLRERVRECPDGVAVVYGCNHLTYSDLLRQSVNLAAHLRNFGVARDDRVGLFVEPSLDLMVGAWGILFSGGAYLPLSPEYPEERLRYMIKDACIDIVFSQEHLRERLTELAPPGIKIVTLPGTPVLTAPSVTSSEGQPSPEDLAYVIYTSGSTGKPKGVMIEHRSIVNQMNWLRAAYGLGPKDVVLQKTPMSFDAAQWEILAPACGSTVVMGGPGVYRDPEALIETVVEYGVTTLQCVPTLLQALLETEKLGRCASLGQIFSGGESLSRNLAAQVLNVLPGCDLVNLYGPTECTINASAFTVERVQVSEGSSAVPIGLPVHNTRYYILDDSLSPAAVGEIGELYVGGVQLARGYLGRPDLTAEKFLESPIEGETRLYRTGDLASWNADGTVQCAGRVDSQVKLRGFRVELDEIKLAIEAHDWVKNAAVIVKDDPRTGFQNLIACVELSPREAALMDQGNHGAHHRSKESKLQVRAQLSNAGARDAVELAGKPVVDLPGSEPSPQQRRQVFARKTYRFFEGGDVTEAEILQLLSREQPTAKNCRDLSTVSIAELGEILRYFGQFHATERLLPKYGYASPGSLYATQMYLELSGIGGLRSGRYYYHPVRHQLVLIQGTPAAPEARLTIHFMGKKRAIEPVYKNNIQEVLEIETGHMVGLLDEVLPAYGLGTGELEFTSAVRDFLECADDDYYLGTVGVVPSARHESGGPLDIYVQAHPGKIADLSAGQYQYRNGALERAGDELVRKKDVIAINQRVYDRSQFGVAVLGRPERGWLAYVDLGRALQRLQMNDLGLGLMSSGYSSETGNDLPAAKRIAAVLPDQDGRTRPSYFFVGGRVSPEQVRSEGMREDTVHMQGPAEMIKEDLPAFLPDYMVPNKVVVLDRLPLTANGKCDVKALQSLEQTDADFADRPFVPPRSRTEKRIGDIWKKLMRRDAVSVEDDFFAAGGNSLIAVSLINQINKAFASSLPLQALFESPTVEQLAHRIDGDRAVGSSRLIGLRKEGPKGAVYCWPGLGGYPMNLRLLADRLDIDRPFYGIQAQGINQGETPHGTIAEMAAADIEIIRRLQREGPYTLWGYSFGARVAFEAAHQLEQSGEQVENLFLIAPGAPRLRASAAQTHGGEAAYRNPAFVTILFSVFAGTVSGSLLEECLRQATDEEAFAAFIGTAFTGLDTELVKRIVRIVRQTYEFTYTFRELAERRIKAPVTIFKAQGDDYSFLDNSSGFSAQEPTVITLRADHYSLLREPDIDELLRAVRLRMQDQDRTKEIILPHVNIKHFPTQLGEERESELIAAVVKAVQSAFECNEGVISIALEPVERDSWNERVYVPELVGRKELLRKAPKY